MPPETWDLLWRVFSIEADNNPNRMTHVYILAKDMNAAGVSLSDPQQLLAIEAMYVDGWNKEAIENWKRSVSTMGSKP